MMEQSPLPNQHHDDDCMICVTTSNPSISSSSCINNYNGALTTICARTGAVQSTLHIHHNHHSNANNNNNNNNKPSFGLSSFKLFPALLQPLAIGVGGCTNQTGKPNNNDAYLFLLSVCSIRGGKSRVHWKCRLPETSQDMKVTVSPCGHYVMVGTASGTLYVWNALGGGGKLLGSIHAHYRSVTVLEWCHGFLVTGGQDGMIHLWMLSQLVDSLVAGASVESSSISNNLNKTASASASKSNPIMLRTWSQHHVAITAITALSSGRIASASQDGRVHVLDMYASERVLATFTYDCAIRCLTYHSYSSSLLFMGGSDGVIRVVDVDAYAMHQTLQQQLSSSRVNHLGALVEPQSSLSNSDQVWGGVSMSESLPVFRSELRGHNRAITTLTITTVTGGNHAAALFISGDEAGCVRFWDMQSRICTRILHPWSSSSISSSMVESLSLHPVTSIQVMAGTGIMRTGGGGGGVGSMYKEWAHRVMPFQSFVETNHNNSISERLSVALRPNVSTESMAFWLRPTYMEVQSVIRQHEHRIKNSIQNGNVNGSATSTTTSTEDPETQSSSSTTDTMERLQAELQQAKETIQRWETVNNTLLDRLKSGSSTGISTTTTSNRPAQSR